jgi:hypothetical protein
LTNKVAQTEEANPAQLDSLWQNIPFKKILQSKVEQKDDQ